MKFPTQHKDVQISDGSKNQKYRLHRDKKKVWATSPSKGKEKVVAVFSHTFDYVSEAKAWMETPDFNIS